MEQNKPTSLVGVNEYLRTVIRNHPDKSQLSIEAGVRYHRLNYFFRNPGSTLQIDDMQKLMAHFGVKLAAELPTVSPMTWVVHPDNPAYEYEVDMTTRHPTGKVRAIAKSVAAE